MNILQHNYQQVKAAIAAAEAAAGRPAGSVALVAVGIVLVNRRVPGKARV